MTTTVPALTPLLALVDSPATSPVEYVIGGTALIGADRDAAAHLLADDAMVIACGDAPVLDWWRARRDGGQPQTGNRLRTVQTYAKAFGQPGQPANVDHVQGKVAELLWNRLMQERTTCRDGRRFVHKDPVKMDTLEPGGDGLVVYRDVSGVLVFRLWEIKKHDAMKVVSATIYKASNQLADRGHDYLAKLTAPATLAHGGQLGELYANMVELWFDRSPRVGVGVSVGTSTDHAPTPRSFGSINTAFPDLTAASQTESIVVTVPNFADFADQVKRIVWSGL